MNVDVFIQRIGDHPAIAIDAEELSFLLDRADVIRESDTGIAGPIRILEFGNRTLVQEQTPEGDLFVRELSSQDAGHRFIQTRLDAYERMWDG